MFHILYTMTENCFEDFQMWDFEIQVSNGTTLIVSRVLAASPPISGKFSVTFQNKTMDGMLILTCI